MKDSREISEQDRAEITPTVNSSPYNRFLITHGTYTMAEKGRCLTGQLDFSILKIVVLVGSIIPVIEQNSDAAFSLVFACGAAMMLQNSGVYIAFHSKIWDPDVVKKFRDSTL